MPDQDIPTSGSHDTDPYLDPEVRKAHVAALEELHDRGSEAQLPIEDVGRPSELMLPNPVSQDVGRIATPGRHATTGGEPVRPWNDYTPPPGDPPIVPDSQGIYQRRLGWKDK